MHVSMHDHKELLSEELTTSLWVYYHALIAESLGNLIVLLFLHFLPCESKVGIIECYEKLNRNTTEHQE